MSPDIALRRAIIAARSYHAEQTVVPSQLTASIGQKLLGMERLKHIVAAAFGVSVTEMELHRRHTPIKESREVAVYLCSTVLNKSDYLIGQAFAKRDRTTIFYIVAKTGARIIDDPEFAARVDAIRQLVSQN